MNRRDNVLYFWVSWNCDGWTRDAIVIREFDVEVEVVSVIYFGFEERGGSGEVRLLFVVLG